MPIRSIPPVTPMRGLYPTGGGIPPKKQRQNVYYKPTRNTPMPKSANVFAVNEIAIDVFEEDNKFKIIGNFPGINIEDIVIQIAGTELCMVTKPSVERKYEAYATIPEGCKIESKEMRNGVVTLILKEEAL